MTQNKNSSLSHSHVQKNGLSQFTHNFGKKMNVFVK